MASMQPRGSSSRGTSYASPSAYPRPSTSTSQATSYAYPTAARTTNTLNPFHPDGTHIGRSRPRTSYTDGRSTARPRTGVSTLGFENQQIICAISESRGISPTVGLAFVNLDTAEAVLSQISDSQTYVKTSHKLAVFNPSDILMVATAADPKSKLFSIIEEDLDELQSTITVLDRRYWAETSGVEYIQHLAFAEDVDAVSAAVNGHYYAVCSFAATLKYIELSIGKTFPRRSLRIKYEPPEGHMMIDLSTIRSLELAQNLHHAKSNHCLFGLLNQTLTPMGARLLRANILQPLADSDVLTQRYDALEELSTKEEMFFGVRSALKPFFDGDKLLTQLILIPVEPNLNDLEQAVNNVIMLKTFVGLIHPIFEALSGSRSTELAKIQGFCASENVQVIKELIDSVINEDTAYASKPLDLRNQRTYAVKSGVNGLLDVARQTYLEVTTDAIQYITELREEHDLELDTKFDHSRQFYMRLSASELAGRNLPQVFINVYRKKDVIECQTLDLMKRNQKIADAHAEVLMMSDKSVRDLISGVREHMSVLFKICEGIAMLDMLAAFAQMVTTQDYIRPQLGDTLAIHAGRHPIREKIHNTKFVPNDVYATQQTRFQIITGCNMSGKSTYIRSVALMTVMAQIGSFVPAEFASFPIIRQLFARVSVDDNIEANVSTFASEMREAAFILRNIDPSSMAIIDELGRGTSTRDGLAIALAIAEALIESRALVWFATHFRDLASILAERSGVVNYHLRVDMRDTRRMEMLYRIDGGTEQGSHYGLQLAKVVPLPQDVVQYAETVSRTLEQRMEKSTRPSLGLIENRRRKVLLNLKEQLVQAKNGTMAEEDLRVWLKGLQRDFVMSMTALDDEEKEVQRGVGDDGNVEGGSVQLDDGDCNYEADRRVRSSHSGGDVSSEMEA